MLVRHNRLELLVGILHVAQAEVEAIHQGLVVEASVGREHVKGLAVRQVAQAERALPGEHGSGAGLTREAGREHELFCVGGERGGLLLLSQTVQ